MNDLEFMRRHRSARHVVLGIAVVLFWLALCVLIAFCSLVTR